MPYAQPACCRVLSQRGRREVYYVTGKCKMPKVEFARVCSRSVASASSSRAAESAGGPRCRLRRGGKEPCSRERMLAAAVAEAGGARRVNGAVLR